MSTPNNNYAPPHSVVADVTPAVGSFELATRGSRLAAAILDGLIFGVPMLPIYVSFGRTMWQHGMRPSNAVVAEMFSSMGWYFALAGLVELVLFVILIVMVYRSQQTYGKRIMHIKVARTDGSRASLARIFWLRNFVSGLIGAAANLIPVVGALYPLVDILFIFGGPRRCIHDYIADTIVIQA
jgi:uncharacterized RDD family membrane protein YckC